MTARTVNLMTAMLFAIATTGSAFASGPTKLKQPNGFPIVISKPGSYVLTSDLVVPDADTTAIKVSVDDVSIDLGGFSIIGPVACSEPPPNNPLNCSATGAGIGIDASTMIALTVTNGTIRGMGGDGVTAAEAQLRNLAVISNGGNGIELFANSVVTGCKVSLNKFGGIMANGWQRTVNGIAMGAASTVTGNTVINNGTYGIYDDSGTVSGNTVAGNSTGIEASFGGAVIGNTVTNNAGVGLIGGCGGFVAGYRDNVFFNNNGGNANAQIQAGCNLNLGGNACGAALCP